MHILSLSASNVLRLEAVSITPGDGAVVISGDNAQGKTSVLNSIVSVLGGAKQRPEELLRRGAKKGEIVIKLGNTKPELIAKLVTSGTQETLTVTTADGAKFSSPQQILDGMVGALGFSPTDFLRHDEKKQVATLQSLVGLNFTDLDAERKRVFESRTDVNKEVKQAEIHVHDMPSFPDAPKAEVSVAELSAKLQAVNDRNADNERQRTELRTAATAGKTLGESVEEQRKTVSELQEQLKKEANWLALMEAKLEKDRADYQVQKDKVAKLIDAETKPLLDQIETAESTNRQVRANVTRETWIYQLKEKRDEADALTKRLDEIDAKKAADLAAANMPVKGLGWDETGVTFYGFPLKQASSAEQLIIAMNIGRALNPKLRVMLFRDANDLDTRNMKLVQEFCIEHDIQAWLERVAQDVKGCVVIEEGRVKDAELL